MTTASGAMDQASDTIKQGAHDAKARLQNSDALAQARERLEQADGYVRRMVDEEPLLALGAAVGVGYLVGRVLAKIS